MLKSPLSPLSLPELLINLFDKQIGTLKSKMLWSLERHKVMESSRTNADTQDFQYSTHRKMESQVCECREEVPSNLVWLDRGCLKNTPEVRPCIWRISYTLFLKNVSVDVNEPRAMKFVVQRSNQHFAISFIKRFRRSLLFEIPAESEGQWVHVQFSPNVICPLCSQAWLAAVSWLNDEVRPAVAQMVWFHIKTRGKLSFCFLQIKIFQ